MVFIEISTHRRFSLGIFYSGRKLSNYKVRKIDVGLLLFTVSLVFTKYNA